MVQREDNLLLKELFHMPSTSIDVKKLFIFPSRRYDIVINKNMCSVEQVNTIKK